ncbi:ATP-binding protein [Paenilisteria newyorkensis]|uniref:ATP-binding protein n=1 Tax=Listeria newyorkensis TaxID=1497681 RepID=UPI00066A0A73|nr:ATP-binding protein [Listeria newyorkensis]KMT58609.1 hypothetical protein X559_2975 [Listeria newyorkensis]
MLSEIGNREEIEGYLGIDSRLLYEILGDEIIETDSIAFAEQIRNSVDAGAANVEIDLREIDDDKITISDDGNGMSEETLLSNWLTVGTDNKNDNYSMLGGKGIGRLSLFRIANSIYVETVNNGTLFSLTLTKKGLQDVSSIENDPIPIPIKKQTTTHKNGTKIMLSDLSHKISLDEIEIELENLIYYKCMKKFNILFPESYKKKKFMQFDDCSEFAPHQSVIVVNNDRITYSFECSVFGKKIYSNNVLSKKFQKQIDKLYASFPEKTLDFGEFQFQLVNFFFLHNHKTYYKNNGRSLPEQSIKEEFLSANQGINLYRNNFKIYGHGTTDWLNLAELRLTKAGDNIDNKQTFGVITLDSEKSKLLKEKSSREGFIKNDSSKAFRSLILLLVRQFGVDREESNNIMKKTLYKTVNKLKPEIPPTSSPEIKDLPVFDSPSTQVGGSGLTSTYRDSETKETIENVPSVTNVRTVEPPTKNVNTRDPGYPRISNKLEKLDSSVVRRLGNKKIETMLREICSLDPVTYCYSVSFLLRSLTEISMNHYLVNNTDLFGKDGCFVNYVVDNDGLVKKKDGNKLKDISISVKIKEIRKYLSQTNTFDKRSLNHLNNLSDFINDLNLAMHWPNKQVSAQNIDTIWQNTMFFFEFLLKNTSSEEA